MTESSNADAADAAVIRILVVDDHPIVREGMVAILEDQTDFRVAASAGTIAEAIALARRETPDVILLDLELPDGNGVDAIPGLFDAAPGARVIVFTAYDTDERVLGALRAGARGYLLKGASADEIVHAIRAVAAGGSHLASRVASKVLAEMRSPRRGRLLTAREQGVLREVAAGSSTKEIARRLGITERTVKFHVTSICNKLGASNRAQAVAEAARRGLL